jgi:hypothetical protein
MSNCKGHSNYSYAPVGYAGQATRFNELGSNFRTDRKNGQETFCPTLINNLGLRQEAANVKPKTTLFT